MKYWPILFIAEMVRGILEDRKLQTRRLNKLDEINKNPDEWKFVCIGLDHDEFCQVWFKNKITGEDIFIKSPYGGPGDRLWVREAFFYEETSDEYGDGVVTGPLYRADMPMHWDAKDTEHGDDVDLVDSDFKWKPSIHMFRSFSRITLEIIDIRVERVQEISEEGAKAEGVFYKDPYWHSTIHPVKGSYQCWPSAKVAFEKLWDSINGAKGMGWDVNPWVWVVEFRKVGDDELRRDKK